MRFLGVFITLFLVGYTYAFSSSCKQIKQLNSRAVSGVYIIRPLAKGSPMVVYCEMAIAGGGFTFLPRSLTIRSDAQHVVNVLFTERHTALLKLQHRRERKEWYTLIHPYYRYWSYGLGLLVNSHSGYTAPMNSFMHDYILLGIIPRSKAAQRSYQGFMSNGRNLLFKNCDGNPNSLFAFLPNHKLQAPSTYHSRSLVYERQGLAVNWRRTAIPIDHPPRTMPNQFFFLTELHFGGCGCYTSSNRWTNVAATAIGIR